LGNRVTREVSLFQNCAFRTTFLPRYIFGFTRRTNTTDRLIYVYILNQLKWKIIIIFLFFVVENIVYTCIVRVMKKTPNLMQYTRTVYAFVIFLAFIIISSSHGAGSRNIALWIKAFFPPFLKTTCSGRRVMKENIPFILSTLPRI